MIKLFDAAFIPSCRGGETGVEKKMPRHKFNFIQTQQWHRCRVFFYFSKSFSFQIEIYFY
jgi:hypothetical protein